MKLQAGGCFAEEEAEQATAKGCQKSPRERHTPYWPSKRDTSVAPPVRVLAGMARDGSIFAEPDDGRRWPRPESWEAFARLLMQEQLLLYIGSPILTWLADWMDVIGAELEPEAAAGERLAAIKAAGRDRYCVFHWSPTAGAIVSLSVHMLYPGRDGKRRWQARHIVQSSSWGEKEPSPAFLGELRACFSLLLPGGTQGGTATTPGACGAQTMFALWREKEAAKVPFKREHRPTSECLSDLLEHSVGSYKDSWRPDEVFTTVYELDRTNGFASETRQLPAGTVRGPLKGSHARLLLERWAPIPIPCFTWFGHCAVRIEAPGLPAGDVAPFLVRKRADSSPGAKLLGNHQAPERGIGEGELYAPTAPGIYDVWLWREEAEAIAEREREGSPIRLESIDYAWYWERGTDQLAEWAERLDERRRTALDRDGAGVARLVKTCIVAGIGRLGMAPGSHQIARQDSAGDGTGWDETNGGPDDLPLSLRTLPGDSGAPKHWHAYVLMKQNQSELRVAHEIWKAGLGHAIVGLNVDSVILAVEPPAHIGVDPAAARLGEYKRRAVGGGIFYAMPGAGIQVSPDKLKTPGLPAERRRLVMAGGELPLHGVSPPARGSRRQHAADARRAMHAAKVATTRGDPGWEESFRGCAELWKWYVRQRGKASEGELLDAWAPLYKLERAMKGQEAEE